MRTAPVAPHVMWHEVECGRYQADQPLWAELARAAPDGVLDVGAGTGRVALPLARRDIAVEGLDASAAMVAKLAAKPGGADLPVTIGDMAEVPVTGPFGLVYLIFNTLFGLLTPERQAACFAATARALRPGGAFVIECFVPDVTRFDRGQRTDTLAVTEDSATISLSRHDPVAQRITTQIVTLDEQGLRLRPVALRYAWPTELDLMAGQAGLQLEHRYGGWDRQPFTAASGSHVSVYRRG